MERKGLIPRKYSFSSDSNLSDNQRVNFQWKNIKYEAKDGTQILNGLYGSSNSGEFTAIMGPSGSGKTTLVNVLSGFVQKGMSGQILVNGSKREINTYRKLTSYILQDDYILPRFTVRELITFASKLKIPSTVSGKERQKAIDDCIYDLGLVGQQHQYSNTLSGGQKKRLCIAQEIVNNPPLIFLDEPTSGLDSSSCIQCILLLKRMAEQGRNIICTIHQPSSKIFEIFDSLYMLSDGDCIYKGSTKDLLPYLANQGLKCPKYYIPTDFLTDIAIGLHGEGLTKLKEAIKSVDNVNDTWYNKTDVDVSIEKKKKSHGMTMLSSVTETVKEVFRDCWHDIKNDEYSASNFTQFQVLVKRSFLGQLRDPLHMRLKFFSSIVMGLLLGFMFYDTGREAFFLFNMTAVLYILMVLLMLTGKAPTVLTFPLERTIFEREHRNGWYSAKMYYLATTFAPVPYQIICPILTCGLFYWLTGQPHELHRICSFLLSGIFAVLISESQGLMIGAVSNIRDGTYFGIITSGAALVLNGSILQFRRCPLIYKKLINLMYTTYVLQNMHLSLYSNRESFKCSSFCFITDPMQHLEYMDMDGSFMLNNIILLIFLVMYRTCAFILLRVKLTLRK